MLLSNDVRNSLWHLCMLNRNVFRLISSGLEMERKKEGGATWKHSWICPCTAYPYSSLSSFSLHPLPPSPFFSFSLYILPFIIFFPFSSQPAKLLGVSALDSLKLLDKGDTTLIAWSIDSSLAEIYLSCPIPKYLGGRMGGGGDTILKVIGIGTVHVSSATHTYTRAYTLTNSQHTFATLGNKHAHMETCQRCWWTQKLETLWRSSSWFECHGTQGIWRWKAIFGHL